MIQSTSIFDLAIMNSISSKIESNQTRTEYKRLFNQIKPFGKMQFPAMAYIGNEPKDFNEDAFVSYYKMFKIRKPRYTRYYDIASYTTVHEIKNIPQLKHNIERLGSIKGKIDEMDKNLKDMQQNLTDFENQLFKLSEDPDLQLFEEIEREETKKSNELRDSLKFKKAFKKLKKSLEKGTIYARGISENDIRPFIKDPVKKILQEGPKINNLREILIKTRLILEDEKDPLKYPFVNR